MSNPPLHGHDCKSCGLRWSHRGECWAPRRTSCIACQPQGTVRGTLGPATAQVLVW